MPKQSPYREVGIKVVATTIGGVLLLVLIWLGGLAPANEKRLNDHEHKLTRCAEKNDENANNIKEIRKKVDKIDRQMIEQTIMLKLLLKNQGIELTENPVG